MLNLSYYYAKMKSKLLKNHEILVDYYRGGGVQIGKNCLICTPIIGPDSWLVSIGNNSVISTDVEFVLHDFSISRVMPDKSNLFGRVIIGDNCFVGARSIMMYGVELADNIIVAAGSVVVNSFNESNIVIGGNPAHKIGIWDDMINKYKDKATFASSVRDDVKVNPKILVKRRGKL